MGIYIPKMEMPKDCRECRFGRIESCDIEPTIIRCIILNRFTHEVDWHEVCPLVEVKTPHGRLIEAEMVKAKSFRYLLRNGLESGRVVFWRNIDDAPTIIEAEEGE